jgi:hypothetical protein
VDTAAFLKSGPRSMTRYAVDLIKTVEKHVEITLDN